MKGYIVDGSPQKVNPVLEELRQIEGITIYDVFEQREDNPGGIGYRVSYIRAVFFAIDDEVANYLKLKYAPDVFRSANS